jgi:hypothetical protein
MKTFTSYSNDLTRILNNNLSDNISWGMEMVNDSLRYLTTKYYFNERSYTVPGGTVAQQQFYNLPPQVKNIINCTISIGSVLWQPKVCDSRTYWDALNVITFYQDFPSFFYVFNGKLGIFPIPSSNGNPITINYKTRITDLSMADVACNANIAITTNTTTVTATGATFLKWMEGQWIKVAHSSTDSANGDNQWYQIDTVTSSTVLVLKNPYSGATISGATAVIGEVPILPEDYQDLPLYRTGIIYYTTRFPDPVRAQQYQSLWDVGMKALDDEFGSKTTNVVLTDTEAPIINPNMFTRRIN